MPVAHIQHVFTRRFLWAGFLVGFALGGFFDGIVLHQLLQWHHLLSALEGQALRSLRVQILADGVFHTLMYVLGALGLWLLYRSRREFTGARADRRILADVLIGFGAWHMIDAVFSHWLTGIHRIRMDVADPLAWDIGWVVLFGLPPFIIGLLMKRRYPRAAVVPDRRAGATHGPALWLAALVIAGGGWAALPPAGAQGPRTVTVVLRPDVGPGRFLATLQGAGPRVLWSDPDGSVWILTASRNDPPWRYYADGALFVSGPLLPAGCSAWFGAGGRERQSRGT